MNTQTERLDNHTARLTVEVEPDRLENAKHVAAKKLSQRLNIPGFRKGKAPYRIIVNYVGEGALLEDAVETLGNEIYKEVIAESELDPYGPGQIEGFEAEDKPVFTFVVPLQPTVELNDYRDIRFDYEKPEVEDASVDRSLRQMQEDHAVVEESQRPAALGDRIHAYIDGRTVDDDEETAHAAESEAEAVDAVEIAEDVETEDVETEDASDEMDEDEHNHHVDDKTILHEHDAVISLNEDAVIPGFSEAVVGATVGERREFVLTYPDDEEEYGELAGKRARFDVTVHKIETVTLPALNDDLAARVTKDEETPLSLLELRVRVRENLQQLAEDDYNDNYAREVLARMVETADIHYPEAMVLEQTQRFLQQMDQDLRQRGFTLEDYKRIYRKTDEDLLEEYREPAVKAVERALVMREIARAEGLAVTDERLEEEIERTAARFGDRADSYRQLFAEPFMRQNLASDLMSRLTMERVAAIARGEAPEPGIAPEADTEDDSAGATPPASEAEPEAAAEDEPTDEGETA